jgi:hypothetical protein
MARPVPEWTLGGERAKRNLVTRYIIIDDFNADADHGARRWSISSDADPEVFSLSTLDDRQAAIGLHSISRSAILDGTTRNSLSCPVHDITFAITFSIGHRGSIVQAMRFEVRAATNAREVRDTLNLIVDLGNM